MRRHLRVVSSRYCLPTSSLAAVVGAARRQSTAATPPEIGHLPTAASHSHPLSPAEVPSATIGGRSSAIVSHIHEAQVGKIVQFGGDAREYMLNGVERISKAVSVTLGPKGRNVVIRQPNGEPKITKDGVTVARSIAFDNEFEDVGAKLIRQVAAKTNTVAGDGTTTATVLAWSIFAQGYKAVATGANPMDVKRGIDTAVALVCKALHENARPVKTIDDVRNVATISANGERPLGELIADAVTAVGSDGFLAVLEGQGQKTEWYRPDGWSLEQGFAASQRSLATGSDNSGSASAIVPSNLAVPGTMTAPFLTNLLKLQTELDNPLVVVLNHAFSDVSVTVTLLEAALSQRRPLLLVATQLHPDVILTMEQNHKGGVVLCCALELKGDVAAMEDLAAVCATTPLSPEALSRLSVDGVAAVAGTAYRFVQSIDSTVVTHHRSGAAVASSLAPRVLFLEQKMQRTANEDEREALKARIAKLTGRFAVIRVGGQTAVEREESKDRVIDALNAAAAAISGGIVAGGGTALLHASRQLDTLLAADEDMPQDRRSGILIVRNAARLPMRIIADNAGVDGPVIIENVLEMNDAAKGYDAQNELYVDMFQAGIIDPLRVVRSCIEDAASIAGLMITTEATVCNDRGMPLAPPHEL